MSKVLKPTRARVSKPLTVRARTFASNRWSPELLKWVSARDLKNRPTRRPATATTSGGGGAHNASAARQHQDWDQTERGVPFSKRNARRLQRGCHRLDDDVYDTFLSSSKGGGKLNSEGKPMLR